MRMVPFSLISLIVAVALLLFGQRLYWLFVGGVGFFVGINLSRVWLSGQPVWMVLAFALIAGVVGALFAILFQRLAIGVAAFLAGGHLTTLILLNAFPAVSQPAHGVGFIVGGIIACILALALLDPVLIVLSALVGATMIADWTVHEHKLRLLVFAILLVAGIGFQASTRRKRLLSSSSPRDL
jgi:hypothetical protein